MHVLNRYGLQSSILYEDEDWVGKIRKDQGGGKINY